jgi:hypothetical protein
LREWGYAKPTSFQLRHKHLGKKPLSIEKDPHNDSARKDEVIEEVRFEPMLRRCRCNNPIAFTDRLEKIKRIRRRIRPHELAHCSVHISRKVLVSTSLDYLFGKKSKHKIWVGLSEDRRIASG